MYIERDTGNYRHHETKSYVICLIHCVMLMLLCSEARLPAEPPLRRIFGAPALCFRMGSIASDNKLVPAAVRCDMVLHQASRAGHVPNNGIGGEVRHGVTSGASREAALNKHVTPHLHRESH